MARVRRRDALHPHFSQLSEIEAIARNPRSIDHRVVLVDVKASARQRACNEQPGGGSGTVSSTPHSSSSVQLMERRSPCRSPQTWLLFEESGERYRPLHTSPAVAFVEVPACVGRNGDAGRKGDASESECLPASASECPPASARASTSLPKRRGSASLPGPRRARGCPGSPRGVRPAGRGVQRPPGRVYTSYIRKDSLDSSNSSCSQALYGCRRSMGGGT